MSDPTIPISPSFITVYNGLYTSGFFLVGLIMLTAYFSRSIHRSMYWYIALATVIWWSFIHSLLIGQQLDDEARIPKALCTIQAASVYTIPPTVALSLLGILVQIFILLYAALYKKPNFGKNIPYILLWIQPILYCIIFTISLSVGINNPALVGRNKTGAYCNINHYLPTTVSGLCCFVITTLLVLLEISTFILLYRHRAWVRTMRTSTTPVPISLIIRVTCFSIGPISGSILSVASMGGTGGFESKTVTALIATGPLICGLAFGTQRDIMRAWMFRRPRVNISKLQESNETSGGYCA